jgi:hypothetical protein
MKWFLENERVAGGSGERVVSAAAVRSATVSPGGVRAGRAE